jgi:hypothetical protein
MEMQLRPPATPQWAGSGERRGLDPLGMQNESIELYQSLVPGLGNVTLRMRYYGLYAWLAYTYAQEVGSDDPELWRHFLRRGEALYALVAVAAKDSEGVAGSDWAKREFAEAAGSGISLGATESDSVPHLQQAYGAFGAAYGSPLYALEILFVQPDHNIPVASPKLGERLARSFAEAAGTAADTFREAIVNRYVTSAALESMMPLAPSRIDAESEERQCYEEIILNLSGAERHVARRDTLRLILELAAQSEELPDVLAFRWSMYTGRLPNGEQLCLSTEELLRRREEWWLYHANDLMHVCLEALLGYMLELLEKQFAGGVSMDALVQHATNAVLESLPHSNTTWREFMQQTGLMESGASDTSDRDRVLVETLLRGRHGAKGEALADYAVDALRLLAILHQGTGNHQEVVKHRFGKRNPNVSRTLLSEITFLERNAEAPLRDTLSRLLSERILRRHLWIAVQKLRFQNAYTFLVDIDNGRLVLRRKDGPVFTNPRISPAIRFLRDIHLLSDDGITSLGREALATTV